jgi:hypothetical protein
LAEDVEQSEHPLPDVGVEAVTGGRTARGQAVALPPVLAHQVEVHEDFQVPAYRRSACRASLDQLDGAGLTQFAQRAENGKPYGIGDYIQPSRVHS